jgi:glutamyl/glutaminyl-tRNA synthetase
MMTVSTKRSLLTELEMTGNPHGPSLYHLLEVLGKEKSIARIEQAIAKIN